MKPSVDLFQLIKSLTKSEKRYFNIIASKKKSESKTNNYLKLFNAIDKQEEYDEKKIIDQFSNSVFIKHLPSEKNHLYHLILKSLHLYHSASSPETTVEELLHYVEILYNKGMFYQSKKMAERVKELTTVGEMYLQLIRLSKTQIKLGKLSDSYEDMQAELRYAIAGFRQALEKLENLVEYNELSAEIFLFIRKEGEAIREEADIRKIETIINHPLMSDEKKALSFDAKVIYYFIKATYCFIIGRLEEALSLAIKECELVAARPEKKFSYTAVLSNVCEIALSMKKYDTVNLYMKKLKEVHSNVVSEQGEQFYRYYDMFLRMHVSTGEFSKGIALAPLIENGITRYKKHIHKSRVISFYYHLAYSFFGEGEYKRALQWINKILNDKTDLRGDILGFARILNILIHFELGNHLLLEHLFKSTHRFISTKGKMYQIEIHVLNFLKGLSQGFSGNELKKAMIKLKNDLLPLTNNPFEKRAFEYFNMISWLDGKLEGKSFSEVVLSRCGKPPEKAGFSGLHIQ